MVGFLSIGIGVRALFQVANNAQISPLRLSNTCTLNVVRRAVPKFQRLEPEHTLYRYSSYFFTPVSPLAPCCEISFQVQGRELNNL